MDNKGLSPLIATVLMIAFAVALGTIIMEWSLSFISSDSPCDEVQVDFFAPAGGVCYEAVTKNMRFVLENTGKQDVDHFSINIFDKTLDMTSLDTKSGLEAGSTQTMKISYSPPSTDKLSIKLVPVVISGDEPVRCDDKRLEMGNIPVCS